jgi:pimeloyl-ACP methyl ester carboxylesterase
MKDALVQQTDQNVIAIDWSEMAQNPLYPWPAFSTRYVGKRVAKLLDSLTDTFNIENPDIHLIGHSLGAHVMGYAGMFSKQKISRISGKLCNPFITTYSYTYQRNV